MRKKIVEVQRFTGDAETTIGRFIVDEKHFCFSLEDEHHSKKQPTDTRIPEGEYPLSFVTTAKWSKIMGHPMIMINEVPGFSSILIHPLNTEDETEGCIGPGEQIGYNHEKNCLSITSSKIAYGRLYKVLSEKMKALFLENKTPTIKIYSVTWNSYDEDGNPFTVVDPVVAG